MSIYEVIFYTPVWVVVAVMVVVLICYLLGNKEKKNKMSIAKRAFTQWQIDALKGHVAPDYKCIRCNEYTYPNNNCPCQEIINTVERRYNLCCKVDDNLKPNGDYKPARGLDQYMIEYQCRVCKNKIYINWS